MAKSEADHFNGLSSSRQKETITSFTFDQPATEPSSRMQELRFTVMTLVPDALTVNGTT